MSQRGEINLHLVLTIFLGVGMALFGALTIWAFSDNVKIHNNLNATVAKAKSDAASKQKQDDTVAYIKANEDPYRVYTADPVHGSFQLSIPKSWSLYAGKSPSSPTLDLIANPDLVNLNLAPNALNTQAFELQLQSRSVADVNRGYEALIKKKQLSSKAVSVSGIAATWYEGTIDDQKHDGVVVTLPVRDKTMVISAQSRTFLVEFQKILDSAKINP